MSIIRVSRSHFLKAILATLSGALAAPMLAGPRTDMLVSTQWLQRRLKDPSVVVLHVARTRAHYTGGHIPGACFIPWDRLVVTRNGVMNELPPAADLVNLFESCGAGDNSRIVLCGDSTLLSASRAWFTLDYLGHGSHAALLDGGIEKWRAEKRPVTNNEPRPRQGRLSPRIRPGVLVNLDQMRDLSWAAANAASPDPLIIDARAGADYNANADGTGHIPGAINVYWPATLAGREIPAMKPRAELQRLYKEAGAAPGRTIVTYCGSGVQASQTYFTLKYLGYDVKLYDGSFLEWSQAAKAAGR
jgi:thiosulfate/3-mercaptopyruvate sulfurtransferase